MKLHLPKLLLTAVLAAVNTVGFQAYAEWGWREAYGDYQTGAQYYYDKDADSDQQGTSYFVTEDGEYILRTNTDASTAVELRLCPSSANQERTIAQIELTASNKIFDVAENPWLGNSGFNYKSLTIDCLDIASGEGAVAFGVTDSRDTVNLKTVNGTLSSVNNVGTLTLGVAANEEAGTEASTINLAGTITSTGTMTVNGTLAITSLDGFSKDVVGDDLTNTTHGYRQGVEVYAITTGNVTQGSDFAVTLNGTAITDKLQFSDGSLKFSDGSLIYCADDAATTTGTLYVITSAYKEAVVYDGNSGDTAAATGFRLENGTTVKLTGDSNAGLTEGITIAAGADGKATVMFANGKDQTYASLGLGSLINVESGSYVLGISGSGTVVTTTVSGQTGFHSGEVLVADGGKLVLKKTDGLGWGQGLTTPKVTIKNGTLALGARQTLAYTTLDMQGGATISALTTEEGALADEDAPMLHTHDSFTWEVSNTGNVIESGVVIRVEKEATININSGGELTFKGTFTNNSTTKLNKTGEGSLIFEGAKTAYGLIDVQEGSLVLANGLTTANSGGLTIAEGASLTTGATIFHNGSGAVALNGTVTIDTSTLNTFEIAATGGDVSYSDGTDGFMTTAGASYYLVKGSSASGSTTTTSNGYTLTYGDDGVTFVDTTTNTTEEYYVNTANVQSAEGTFKYKLNSAEAVLNVNGTLSNSRIIMGEGKVAVSAGNTLSIDTGGDNAKELLLTTTGAGNITLATSVTLGSADETKATGKLSISEGATLTMGESQEHTASISSFNTVELDGGKIYFCNKQDTFHNLTVTAKNGTFELYDMGEVANNAKITMAGTTTLNGNLTYINTWNSQIDIEKVSGTGKLILNGEIRNTGNTSTISISSADNFTGSVHITNMATSMKLNVVENLGLNVYVDSYTADDVKNGFDFTGIGAGNTITLQGARGYLANGSTIAANLIIENSSNGLKAGLELNDGYSNSTNTFAGTITGGGNMVINKQDITNVTQKFTGDISGWKGNIDIAGGTDHRVLFTGDTTTINNGKIISRKADGRTVNTGATVTFDHEKAVTVNSELKQEADSTFNVVVKNSSEAGTTFTKSVSVNKITVTEGTNANFNGVVSVSVLEALGNVSLTAQDVLNVTDLTVGQAGELTIVGSLSASGAVTLAGGATINAAVVDLSGASSVSFDVTSGAIALNGALTMSSTKAFVAALGDSLAGLTAGEMLTVFTGVSSFTVGDVTYDASNALTNVDLRDWGADAAVGQYTMTYDTSANVGSIVITAGAMIPEPTTATLSLAALMMLCARRRRRK